MGATTEKLDFQMQIESMERQLINYEKTEACDMEYEEEDFLKILWCSAIQSFPS